MSVSDYIHWWLPGIAADCAADITCTFTGDPAEVTCEICLIYVDMRKQQASAR